MQFTYAAMGSSTILAIRISTECAESHALPDDIFRSSIGKSEKESGAKLLIAPGGEFAAGGRIDNEVFAFSSCARGGEAL